MESKERFKFFKMIEILIGDLLVSITQLVFGTILFLFLRKVIQRQGKILVHRNIQTDCWARPGFY